MTISSAKVATKDAIQLVTETNEAAVAFDPLCGQGVEFAIESAFRAFEAASIADGLAALGPTYQAAISVLYQRHLERRAEVYSDALDILSDAFFDHAVTGAKPHKRRQQGP